MNDCIAQCGIRHVLTSRRVHGAVRPEARRRVGLSRRLCGQDHLGRQAGRRGRGLARAGRLAGAPAGPDGDPRRRSADGHLHLRLDRPAQGRDAHAPQRRLERRGGRPDRPPGRRRRAAGHPADVPLLRLHDHAVDGADAAAEGHLSLHPAGGPRSRQALPQARRDDHGRHAHVRPLLPAAVRAGGFRQAGRGLHRGGEASAELADAFEKRFGVRPVEGYGATELSPVVSGNIPPSRAAGEQRSGVKEGHRRPAAARHRRQSRRSRHRRRTWARTARACCW